MRDVKMQGMLFGGETEYGIFITDGSGKPLNELRHTTIQTMLSASKFFFKELFEGSFDCIESPEEHRMIEEMLLLSGNAKRKMSTSRLDQRHGFTGFYLPNGSRYYEDMGHPEVSIPEIKSPHDALVYQKAGDNLVLFCKRKAEEIMRASSNEIPKTVEIRIDKNNTDGRGNSYGGHENYSLSAETYEEICGKFSLSKKAGRSKNKTGSNSFSSERGRYTDVVMLFFVARQILTGAGKVGFESGKAVPYQISQRADHIIRKIHFDTMVERSIINVRDIPYSGGDEEKRRLHVIVGDSNVGELSIYLKFGITALFFLMLDAGFLSKNAEKLFVPLCNPLLSYHNVSRDLDLNHGMPFEDGRKMSALQIMWEFLFLGEKYAGEYTFPTWVKEVCAKWRSTLTGLSEGRHKNEYSRSLDWVLKEYLLLREQKTKGEDPLSATCVNIDRQCHTIEREENLLALLEDKGMTVQLSEEKEILKAGENPPPQTRAFVRGEIIKRYGTLIKRVCWDEIHFSLGERNILLHLYSDPKKEVLKDIFVGGQTLEECLSRIVLLKAGWTEEA